MASSTDIIIRAAQTGASVLGRLAHGLAAIVIARLFALQLSAVLASVIAYGLSLN